MTHGQAVTQKTWLPTGVLTEPVARIFSRLRDLVKWQIPVGYQDETGFHPGVQPAEKKSNWPPLW
jgi:hypothetical protein